MKFIQISLAIVGTLFVCYLPILNIWAVKLQINKFEWKNGWNPVDYFGQAMLISMACASIIGTVALVVSWKVK